jgi:hypothetical protein
MHVKSITKATAIVIGMTRRIVRRKEAQVTDSAKSDQVHRRAVIWIDHLKARIFTMGMAGVSSSTVHAHLSSSHLHHHANAIGSGHVKEDPDFLAAIARSVAACDETLILGPGIEKSVLKHHLQSVRPKMTLHLESSDHPTDDEIVAIGRRHFGLSEPRA